MKILLLTSWFLVLLLLYLRFQSKWNIRRSMREAEKKKESDTGNYSSDDDDILGKTRTEFPSRGMRGNAKEPDQNRKEKGDSFAVGKSSDPPEKEGVRAAENEDSEFYPSLPENETDEMLEEQEALSLLLDREIEVSTDSLTVKELQRLRTAAEEPEQLTETDKALVRETAGKLRGTEFLEKLRAHEQLQRERGRELLGLLSHPPEEMAEKGRKAKKNGFRRSDSNRSTGLDGLPVKKRRAFSSAEKTKPYIRMVKTGGGETRKDDRTLTLLFDTEGFPVLLFPWRIQMY